MGADVGADLLGQPDDTAHDRRVAAVESGRDVGGRHQRKDAGIVTQGPAAKPFAHVAVDVDLSCHSCCPKPIAHGRIGQHRFLRQPDLFCLSGVDRPEVDDVAGFTLSYEPDVAADDSRDLGVATEAGDVGAHDDRFQSTRDLDPAQGRAVVDDVGWIGSGLLDQVVGAGQEFEFRPM